VALFDAETPLSENQRFAVCVSFSPPSVAEGGGGGRTLRATLVWTDPPAATISTQALVNDLDLELRSPDGTMNHETRKPEPKKTKPGTEKNNQIMLGIYKTVQARLWRLLSGEKPSNVST
jgi:hypothetical protein